MITVVKCLPKGFYLDTDEVFQLQALIEPAVNAVDEEEDEHGSIIHNTWRRLDSYTEGNRSKNFWISYPAVRYLQTACDHHGHSFRMFGMIMEKERQHDGPFDTY